MDSRDMQRLNDVRDQLSKQIDAGFNRINMRLDILNGRVGKGEVESAQHGMQLKNIERELFPAGGRRKTDPDERPAPVPLPSLVSNRDVRMVVAGVTGTIGVLAFFTKLLPMLLKALP